MRQNGIEPSAGKHAETLLKYRGILRIFALSRIPWLRYYDGDRGEEKGKDRERKYGEKKDVRVTAST